MVVDYNSNCLVCACDGWLPVPIGQVRDFKTLGEAWSSPTARMLQQDVDSQRFTWCAVEHCGIRQHDIHTPTHELAINIDESCNLFCPSCRRDRIMHSSGAEFERKQQDMDRILEWLAEFPEPIHIITSGNGDPLASLIMRRFLQNYQPRPGQTFTMFTNGLLIKKQLSRLPILDAIKNFRISIDAATADTYQVVRRGGDWKLLLDNLDFLTGFGDRFGVTANFCLQQKNYREVGAFIELCESRGFWPRIHELDDWGTWSQTAAPTETWTIVNGTFHDNQILAEQHPDHVQCRDMIANLLNQNPQRRVWFSHRVLELLRLT